MRQLPPTRRSRVSQDARNSAVSFASPSFHRPISGSVAGSLAAVGLLLGLLVALSYPVAAVLFGAVALTVYGVVHVLPPRLATTGLPMPGTGARLRVLRRQVATDDGVAWTVTVAVDER